MDTTYQPKVYKDFQGDRLNVVKAGQICVGSSDVTAMSTDALISVNDGGRVYVGTGATVTIASGSSMTVSTALEFAVGGYPVSYLQALTTATAATAIVPYGITTLVATTAGPAYTLAAPTAAGQLKYISISGNTSGATCRATINMATTGIGLNSTGANVLTLTTATAEGVTLAAASATRWHVVGFYAGGTGLTTKAT